MWLSREEAYQHILRKYGNEAHVSIDGSHELYYMEYERTYGSTAGPYGGVGGQMITAFRMQAWYSPVYCYAVVFVPGKVVSITDDFLVSVQTRAGDKRGR